MALDPNSAIGQAETANAKLAEYFNNMYRFLNDSTGAVEPPKFADYVDSLDFSELHRMTSIRANDIASYENGAAIENIHLMVAVIREFDMRNKRKADYYNDAASDSLKESTYYATLKVFWVNMMNGIYVEGEGS